MVAHLGIIGLIKLGGKTLLEYAIEYYVSGIIKKDTNYMIHHINEICHKDTPEIKDSYLARSSGYCTLEKTLQKLESSNSQLANDIKELIAKLHEEGDFLVVEQHDPINQHTDVESTGIGSTDIGSTDIGSTGIGSTINQPTSYLCIIQ